MIKMIIITEECSVGSCTGSYNYELLPDNVKNKIQEALYPKFGILNSNSKSTEVDIYRDGLQYLYGIKHPMVNTGEIVEYMGSVTFYHDEGEDEDDE